MIGLRTGLKAGIRTGGAVGVGADPMSAGGVPIIAGVTRDATSGKYIPQSAAEWDLLLAAAGLSIGPPVALYLLQEASGSAADSIGVRTLTVVAGTAYRQAVTGWSTLAMQTTDDSVQTISNTTFGDIATTSMLALVYAEIVTDPAAGERTLFTCGANFDADAALEISAVPRLRANSGVNDATSTGSPLGSVRPFIVRIDQTGNTVFACSDAEKLQPTFSGSMSGTTLQLGGNFSNSWNAAGAKFLYAAVFAAGDAELTPTQIRTLVQTLGFTVGWSP